VCPYHAYYEDLKIFLLILKYDEIINDQNMVAECFNDFFINVAKDIGNVTVVDKNHPSIIEINKIKKIYLILNLKKYLMNLYINK
jgi:hypothetical protein